jgi:hypothetical protein
MPTERLSMRRIRPGPMDGQQSAAVLLGEGPVVDCTAKDVNPASDEIPIVRCPGHDQGVNLFRRSRQGGCWIWHRRPCSHPPRFFGRKPSLAEGLRFWRVTRFDIQYTPSRPVSPARSPWAARPPPVAPPAREAQARRPGDPLWHYRRSRRAGGCLASPDSSPMSHR